MVSQTDEIRKTGDIGGQPKMTYWTPDGRMVRAMPDMHEYSRTQNGKVVENGIRDANLDKGWLLQKPDVLKPYCEGCDRWHDTQKEINSCIKKKELLTAKHAKKAQKELGVEGANRIETLESDMADLKKMMKQLITTVAKEHRNG